MLEIILWNESILKVCFIDIVIVELVTNLSI